VRSLAAAVLIAAIASPIAATAVVQCADTDKICARQAALAHPLRSIESWRDTLKLPVEARFGPASPALVEYLTLDNIAGGFPERPRPATLSADFVADVRAALDELPVSAKRALGKDFGGIYFVESLGGTGYTDYIRDGAREVGSFIVLDVNVLAKHTANAWATWKENTPFVQNAGYSLRARIALEAHDHRKAAIQYILLHELGHVVSTATNVHPSWAQRPRDVKPAEEYPYFRLSWRVQREGDRYVSVHDADFPERAQVVYYLGPKLQGADMERVYAKLQATSFPTLYAATHPADDFAEAFANYVHVVLMRKPFAIELVRDGRMVKSYGSCWNEARCAEKRRMLEALLAAP
jgi:hypothetical protein